jgi:ABC-type polysaccharide transport system, permease component
MTAAQVFRKNKYIYVLLIPAIVYLFLFAYQPMYGIILSFKKFNFAKGITGSPWIGLANFSDAFTLPGFWTAFRNTVIIAGYRILIAFPVPVVLAILINEAGSSGSRRFFQTVYTFPHFLSWIIISGILLNIFGNSGVANQLLESLGCKKVEFLTSNATFRPFIIATDIWKEAGWGTIIYLAAIAGIDQELYEAAALDGIGRFQRMWHITFKSILPTVSIMLILQLGTIMQSGGGGFDQIFNLYNAAVYDVGDIIDTFIYRSTFGGAITFGVSTAIGLFKSVLNFLFLFGGNALVRWTSGGERGIF